MNNFLCFSDRFRTTINVLGDSLGAGLVNELSRVELENMPMPEGDRYESRMGPKKEKAGTSDDAEWHTTPI